MAIQNLDTAPGRNAAVAATPPEKKPAGLVGQAMPEGEAPEGNKPADQENSPALQQAEQQLRAHIPPEMVSAVDRIVNAGKTVMYSDQTRSFGIEQLKQPGDVKRNIVMGVGALITLLGQQAKGPMPGAAIPPATFLLMLEALDFAEQGGLIEATPDVIAEVTQDTAAMLMQKMGMTPDKVKELQASLANGEEAPPEQAAPPAGPAPSGMVGGAMPPQGV